MDNKLKVLLDISSEIAKHNNIKDVLGALSDIVRTLLDADRASIYLHDEEKNQLWTIVSTGVEKISILDHMGIAGEVFQTGALLNIPDAYKDERFDQNIDKETGYKTKSLLAYPLKSSNNKMIGVFQMVNKLKAKAFSKEDELLLEHVAIYAASQIENSLLQTELKKSSEEAIYRLSFATKFRDPETQNHIIRVGLYGKVLAKLLGLSDEEQEWIKLAAPMHDIGKVAIPDHILQKPGKLDPDDWEVMKKHCQYGYDILKGGHSKLMDMAATIAIDHHEKFNGTGYPNQKKGEQISLVGRITAVSDVFDALTSRRCYKEAWGYDEAANYIQTEKGDHFDPQIAELFLGHMDTMIKIKEDYKDE